MWKYDDLMKQKLFWVFIGLIVVSVIGLVIYIYHRASQKQDGEASSANIELRMREAYDAKLKDGTCKIRGDAYDTRARALEREAHATLKIGVKKNTIIRFFAENGIPVTFTRDVAEGTIYTVGCSPLGCGTDNALLGLRVGVDKKGTIISEPVIGSIYTDCL
jgi:uncharacterized protein YpmB